MSINVYEEVVIGEYYNEDEIIETNEDQHFVGNHEQITTLAVSNRSVQKRRGRPPKEDFEEARLAALGALYHSYDYNNGSNGALATPNSQKKRCRPPKSDREKSNQSKTGIRIALGPKSPKFQRTEAVTPNDEASLFPLVQQTDSIRKSRGRPRIHPPKDASTKRPRGRPRLVPLEGEDALRSAFLKLKRDCAKKDLIIMKLKERLEQFGHPVDDILQESKNLSKLSDDTDEQNQEENESCEDVRQTPDPGSMEDAHQTYIGMFANTEGREGSDSGSE